MLHMDQLVCVRSIEETDRRDYAWESKLTKSKYTHAYTHTVTLSRSGGEMYPHIRVVIRQMDMNIGQRET